MELQLYIHKKNTNTMGATKILRASIHTFLSNLPHFTSTPTLLALPFSISLLLLLPTCLAPILLPHFHLRLHSLFLAAGFPSSSLFSLLSLKLSQTLVSAVSTLPFSLSFLLLSKSSVIQSLHHTHHQSPPSSFFNLLTTHLCNSLILLAAHSACFSLISLAFTTATSLSSSPTLSSTWVLFISASGAVFYSIVVAKAVLVCNLSLIVSGRERISGGGFLPVIKACLMLRGKTLTALSLALPANIAMAAVEWLFSYRIIDLGRFKSTWIVAGEGLLIGYLYSVLIVIDVIVGCFFYQSCCCQQDEEEEEQDQIFKDYASDDNKLRALEQGIAKV